MSHLPGGLGSFGLYNLVCTSYHTRGWATSCRGVKPLAQGLLAGTEGVNLPEIESWATDVRGSDPARDQILSNGCRKSQFRMVVLLQQLWSLQTPNETLFTLLSNERSHVPFMAVVGVTLGRESTLQEILSSKINLLEFEFKLLLQIWSVAYPNFPRSNTCM